MTTAIRPRRSVLYMPGSNARAIEKARTLPADALILDLEDAVAPDAKEPARAQVCQAVQAGGFGKREVIIRVNALSTPWGESDLAAAIAARPDAILIPKVSGIPDIQSPGARLADRGISLWAMIETPRAVLDIAAIAASGGNLACLVMGTNDLVKEMRGRHMRDRDNLAVALGLAVTAARTFGLCVIDGVFNDIADTDGFRGSCLQARDFGFDGKTLIHPSQIACCNAVFAPSREEIEAACKVISAFESPGNSGKGAIALDGRMVERLHMDMARQTVALAEAIAAQEASSH
ncbi:MAG TPA: CoA ester lyase [Rhizomicrobium sp.]|jgi:citrate lyase subunit beta/citryl-CoA lyase|nr:CoA ester lyase [Rhizomicrobium sp.]